MDDERGAVDRSGSIGSASCWNGESL